MKSKHRSSYKPPYPSDGIIYTEWLTVAQAAKIMNMSHAGVRFACGERRIRSKKLGSERRGEWRIDPTAAKEYKRQKPRA